MEREHAPHALIRTTSSCLESLPAAIEKRGIPREQQQDLRRYPLETVAMRYHVAVSSGLLRCAKHAANWIVVATIFVFQRSGF
jgi:hypothetical protein